MIISDFYFPKITLVLFFADLVAILFGNAVGMFTFYGFINLKYILFIFAIALLWIFSIFIADGYRVMKISKVSHHLRSTLTAASLTIATLVLIVAYVLYKGRINVGQSFSTFILFPLFALYLERFLFPFCVKHDWFIKGVLILGTGELAQELKEVLRRQKQYGFNFAGFIEMDNRDTQNGVEKVDEYNVLISLCEERDARCLAVEGNQDILPGEIKDKLEENGVRVVKAAKLYEWLTRKIPKLKLKEADETQSDWVYKEKPVTDFFRRITSLVLTSFGTILALLVSPFIMIGIKLDSRGSCFYIHERVGKGGRVFKLAKFRTMEKSEPDPKDESSKQNKDWMDTSVPKGERPRVTKFGRFLRKYNLDEIPQLFNILKGDMNLVGPRPEQRRAFKERCKLIPNYKERIRVKPGITGWAPIHYPFEDAWEKLQYDLFYIKHRSALLDLIIILRTIRINLLTGRDVV